MVCKLSVVLLGLVAGVLAKDTYTNKYDNIDLDEILSNQRLYQKYFDCITGEGKCTADGAELKERIPEALSDGCAKCSEKQKRGADKALRFIMTKKAEDFKVLEEKFDPEGIYRKKYETERKLLEEGKPVEYLRTELDSTTVPTEQDVNARNSSTTGPTEQDVNAGNSSLDNDNNQ